MELVDMGLGLEGTHVLVTGAAGFIGTIHTSLLPAFRSSGQL
jgi:NADPH:quinone reductase-like Zn-dependent oxidoreductase